MSFADRVQYWGARLSGRLPARVQRWLSGEPPVTSGDLVLDPHMQLLRGVRRRTRAPRLLEPDWQRGRVRFSREMAAFAGPTIRVAAVRELRIDGPRGSIAARHYAPHDGRERPMLVYYHGGGFVIGDVGTHDPLCRLLCREARVHVLSVDYRLAPEHPFPAGLDDAWAGFTWARANAGSLGADAARVAVGGDSAGGNLAAVVAQRAAREGTPPAAQLLVYPAVDADTERPSRTLYAEGFFLSGRDREEFSRLYTGGTGVSGSDPRVSPLRAASLAGLPPALVVTAGFDVLRDEGDAYADALAAAGNVVRHRRFDHLGHGFVNMIGIAPSARAACVEIAHDLAALLDPERAR